MCYTVVNTQNRMSDEIKGAIVSGASSAKFVQVAGIGLDIAKRLLDAGYAVVAVGRDTGRLEAAFADVSSKERVRFLQCDLSTLEGAETCVDAAVELLPGRRLDLLVNNAGAAIIGQPFGMPTLTAKKFDDTFNLDVKAPYLLTHHAVKHLEPTKGSIINLSSIAASRPTHSLGSYCMAKAAVEMLTKVSALELGAKGIRVNAVAPAVVETNFHAAAGMGPEMAKAYYAASACTHPIGRIGTPHDITEMVLFLADPVKAGFITGAIMLVDGGRLLTSSMANMGSFTPAPK